MNLLSYNACSTIIHAFISCRLDYCNSLLYNVPTHKTDRMQRLQNQCARILIKSQRREHITPVLKSLHWLKIQDRITYKILMLTYKSYYNIAPTYLCEPISRTYWIWHFLWHTGSDILFDILNLTFCLTYWIWHFCLTYRIWHFVWHTGTDILFGIPDLTFSLTSAKCALTKEDDRDYFVKKMNSECVVYLFDRNRGHMTSVL